MVRWRPSSLKLMSSLVIGLSGCSFGISRAWAKHLEYQGIAGLGIYYGFWGTIVRDELWGTIIGGFIIGFIITYILYSLVQERSEFTEIELSE